MREARIPFPELALIAATRGALGLGLGLLLADRLSDERRKELGWAFLAVGVLSTFPLAADVLGRRLSPADEYRGARP
ncbi:MAG TPA: hypothetical protein VGF55_16850 [Gemmataceae bacterium]|jgi:hypothetical protein